MAIAVINSIIRMVTGAGASPHPDNDLLLEDGFIFLLETGDSLLTE